MNTAEKASWVSFPEKVVANLKKEQIASSERKWVCPYHGEGVHPVKYFPVIKKVESLGWRRVSTLVTKRKYGRINKIQKEVDLVPNFSKSNSDYFRNINSCFLKYGRVQGKNVKVLLDTGADVSLIPESLVDKKNSKISFSNEKLRSVCGREIQTAGKWPGVRWKSREKSFG